MPKREKVYERALKTVNNRRIKATVNQLITGIKDEVGIEYTYAWEECKPVLYVDTKFASWTVVFAPERVVVFAEITRVGRVFDTRKNRRKMVELLDRIVDELNAVPSM